MIVDLCSENYELYWDLRDANATTFCCRCDVLFLQVQQKVIIVILVAVAALSLGFSCLLRLVPWPAAEWDLIQLRFWSFADLEYRTKQTSQISYMHQRVLGHSPGGARASSCFTLPIGFPYQSLRPHRLSRDSWCFQISVQVSDLQAEDTAFYFSFLMRDSFSGMECGTTHQMTLREASREGESLKFWYRDVDMLYNMCKIVPLPRFTSAELLFDCESSFLAYGLPLAIIARPCMSSRRFEATGSAATTNVTKGWGRKIIVLRVHISLIWTKKTVSFLSSCLGTFIWE